MHKLEWDEILAEYSHSGLSQSAFAKRKGISSSALSERLRARRRIVDTSISTQGDTKFISLHNMEKIELDVGGLFKVYLSEKQLVTVIRSLRD